MITWELYKFRGDGQPGRADVLTYVMVIIYYMYNIIIISVKCCSHII